MLRFSPQRRPGPAYAASWADGEIEDEGPAEADGCVCLLSPQNGVQAPAGAALPS